MASTAKSAVSDYEHLKYRFGDENYVQISDSEDEDFLPLKARSNQNDAPSSQNRNQNNHSSCSNKLVKMSEYGFDSIERVPVASAWSPGMIIKPNPYLSITPEKPNRLTTSAQLGLEKDNILEPRDLNQVPTPVAWSPHPMLKPSVLITPEKPADTVSSLRDTKTETSKSKEKHTVRFDLPSISSGDEFMDSSALSSDSFSPITIQGKELSELSCPSIVYNPMIYSDDSVLDDSVPEINESDMVSLSTSANLVDKLNQLLMTSKGLDDKKYVSDLPSTKHSYLNSSSNKTTVSSMSLKDCTSSAQSSNKKVTSDSSVKVKKPSVLSKGTKTSKKYSQHPKDNKSGPHHLSSSVSPYHPPYSGACIVREAKHPIVSTEYSYPFKTVEDTQEYEHIFSRPEFNSTLKVRSELDSLCDQDVDVKKAVENKLSKSSTKRTEIQEKAAVFTNHSSDQFVNLVDLEPSIDRLCDRVVRMRTSKVLTQNKARSQEKKSSNKKTPDLMEFYSGDLQKESPDLSLPGISPVAAGLMGAPHDQTFECYRHNRAWRGLQDF